MFGGDLCGVKLAVHVEPRCSGVPEVPFRHESVDTRADACADNTGDGHELGGNWVVHPEQDPQGDDEDGNCRRVDVLLVHHSYLEPRWKRPANLRVTSYPLTAASVGMQARPVPT